MMNQKRISLGEAVFPYLSKPEWAETKLKYWSWIVFFSGVGLLFKVLGLPVKFGADFPFIEWEDGKSAELNEMALIVGGCLVIIGFLCSIKIIPKPDPEADQHWPDMASDYDINTPILFMESPTVVDSARVDMAVSTFKTKWPRMTVRWPRSAQRLIDEANEVIKSQHRVDLSDHNTQLTFGQLQQTVNNAVAIRDRCAAALPSVVRRCADLPSGTTSRVVQRLLVLINYQALYPVYQALVWLKPAASDITTPKIWDSLFGKERGLPTLYDVSTTLRLKRAILVDIGEVPVLAGDGSVISVEGRGYDIRHRIPITEASPHILAEVEAAVIKRGGQLPEHYKGDIRFSKIGPGTSTWLPGDGDVAVDPELNALGERYRREWEAKTKR